MPKVSVDNLEITYAISRRSVRYPRLEFRTGNLVVVLPKGKQGAKEIIEKHKSWISQKNRAINEALSNSRKKRLNTNRSIASLKSFVRSNSVEFGEQRQFKVKNIYFRKMNSKWASRSAKGNLTINTCLRYLPDRLLKYVVFHEMAHSVERRHNSRFWGLVEREFKDHQKMERELMAYWFIIQTKMPALNHR